MVDLLDSFIITVCAFISNLLHALRALLEFEPAGFATQIPDFMELTPRQQAVKQLKEQLLQALQANNTQEVLQILHTGKLDIDTVLEVDDPSMVLASYKQGKKEKSGPFFPRGISLLI